MSCLNMTSEQPYFLEWVDAHPEILEDSETAQLAVASMMLTSDVDTDIRCEATKIIIQFWDLQILLRTASSILKGGKAPFPSRTTGPTSRWRPWPLGLGMVMPRQAASCWQKSQTDWSLMFPMWRTPNEEAACWWPTLCHGSVQHMTVSAWMLREPGRWTGTSLIPFQSQNFRSWIIRRVNLTNLVLHSLMYNTPTAPSHSRCITRDLSWGRNPVTPRSTASIFNGLMSWLACCGDHIPWASIH